MPITDSRLKVGTLTVDSLPFASQATNVRMVPKTDEEGDAVEVLSGETITPDDVTTWSLVIVSIQDFDDVDGFVNYCLLNAGELVPVTWQPNPAGPSYAMTARVRPVEVGGDVAKRNSTTAEWPLEGAPTPTYAP